MHSNTGPAGDAIGGCGRHPGRKENRTLLAREGWPLHHNEGRRRRARDHRGDAAGQGRARPIASIEAATAAQEHGLATDQAQAATFILTAKDRVVGVQGYAGTGKTHMLRAVREVAERNGFVVRGFAPSATAARVLQQDAGITSDTLSKHLIDIAKESKPWQSASEVWMVDESSMMSTEQARALVSAADRQKAPRAWLETASNRPPSRPEDRSSDALERGMASHGDASGEAPNEPRPQGSRYG
jgi:hypothetical protein